MDHIVVHLIEIDGQEWLFYRALPLQIALLRGTTADPNGNVTAEREALDLDNLAIDKGECSWLRTVPVPRCLFSRRQNVNGASDWRSAGAARIPDGIPFFQ
jgi:hypothetical protein